MQISTILLFFTIPLSTGLLFTNFPSFSSPLYHFPTLPLSTISLSTLLMSTIFLSTLLLPTIQVNTYYPSVPVPPPLYSYPRRRTAHFKHSFFLPLSYFKVNLPKAPSMFSTFWGRAINAHLLFSTFIFKHFVMCEAVFLSSWQILPFSINLEVNWGILKLWYYY